MIYVQNSNILRIVHLHSGCRNNKITNKFDLAGLYTFLHPVCIYQNYEQKSAYTYLPITRTEQ